MLNTGDKGWSADSFDVKFPKFLFQALTFLELKRQKSTPNFSSEKPVLAYQEVMKLHLQKLSRQASVAGSEHTTASPTR